jgi:hypothetical protein
MVIAGLAPVIQKLAIYNTVSKDTVMYICRYAPMYAELTPKV